MLSLYIAKIDTMLRIVDVFETYFLDLDHMLSFIEPLQSFALSKLEQRHLERARFKLVFQIPAAIWQQQNIFLEMIEKSIDSHLKEITM